MSSKITVVLCFLLTLFTVLVHAVPANHLPSRSVDTNASRMARGLPPMVPKKLKRRATPVAGAKRHSQSQAPTTTFTGKIKVQRTNGDIVGYISKSLTGAGVYTVVNQLSNAVVVSFTAPTTSSSTQLDIKDTTNNRVDDPYIGGASLDNPSIITGGAVPIAGVRQTSPGAGPTSTTNKYRTTSSGDVESAIWKYNPSTKAITVQWVNDFGFTPDNYIVYNPVSSNGGLFITGNVGLYTTFGHPQAYQVLLTFVPI